MQLPNDQYRRGFFSRIFSIKESFFSKTQLYYCIFSPLFLFIHQFSFLWPWYLLTCLNKFLRERTVNNLSHFRRRVVRKLFETSSAIKPANVVHRFYPTHWKNKTLESFLIIAAISRDDKRALFFSFFLYNNNCAVCHPKVMDAL